MAKARDVKRLLGCRIRELRERSGVSQEDFAHEHGLGRSYYARVERGEVDVCLVRIAAIARGLGVGIGELFDWDE